MPNMSAIARIVTSEKIIEKTRKCARPFDRQHMRGAINDLKLGIRKLPRQCRYRFRWRRHVVAAGDHHAWNVKGR